MQHSEEGFFGSHIRRDNVLRLNVNPILSIQENSPLDMAILHIWYLLCHKGPDK